ncbi:MAG TPA: response regulator [Candidatus Paceibacterota bacterium]|nr:response regulator [Candidatus Paceibacterota bacterium]
MENNTAPKKRILIVDDDPDIAEAISLILSSKGYSSKTTCDGAEVAKLAKEYKPDLILLDLLLAGYDGRVICKELKGDKSTKEIPVVMISAHPSAESTVAKAGADGFIPKPFSIDSLMSNVEKHIRL